MSGEKTEEASPQKLRKAREDGDVPKSQDFTSVFILAAVLGALVALSGTIAQRLIGLMHQAIALISSPMPLESVAQRYGLEALETFGWCVAPVCGVALATALFACYVQVGALFTIKPLIPKLDRLNPVQGAKNLVNMDKLVGLGKNLAKIGLMGAVAWGVLSKEMIPLLRAPAGQLHLSVGLMGGAIVRLGASMTAALLAIGIFDLWWTRRSHAKKHRMSKDDVKQEYKQAEGDQQVKGQRKQLHQEMLRDPGVRKVPEADALVVNPTHIAVALQWRPGEMDAPVVLATGRGEVAAKMRALARRWEVPIVRDVPLARALVELEASDEVPPELYEAVAQVLQFVYSLKSPEAPS